jgi:hypothetical protein
MFSGLLHARGLGFRRVAMDEKLIETLGCSCERSGPFFSVVTSPKL